MNPPRLCRRFLVSGRVQGVGFRVATQAAARRLGLDGCACNLADGRVEVAACGTLAALVALEQWLWQGPAGARVTAISVAPAPDLPVTPGFVIR